MGRVQAQVYEIFVRFDVIGFKDIWQRNRGKPFGDVISKAQSGFSRHFAVILQHPLVS